MKKIDLVDFKKIIAIDSTLYTYEWSKLSKEHPYTLFIYPTEPLNDLSI